MRPSSSLCWSKSMGVSATAKEPMKRMKIATSRIGIHSTIGRVACGRRVDGMIGLVAVLCGVCIAAETANLPPPLKPSAQEDHRKMMELLGIKELRRGAEGM